MNSAENTTVTVTVAPGEGRVARRASAVLFDPTGNNSDLIAAFDAAPTDTDAISTVKRQLVDSDFTLSPVSMISWQSGELDLMVWGDVAMHSSVPAAPMITGAGSASWVERRLAALELGDVSDVALWCGDDVDEATDLRLGVVRCGGVRVTFENAIAGDVPAEHEQPGFVAPLSDLAPPEPVESSVPEDVIEEPATIIEPDNSDAVALDSQNEEVDPFDVGEPSPPATALVQAPPPPPAAAMAPPAPPPPLVPPPPPAAAGAFAGANPADGSAPSDEPMARGVGLVEALVCASGHTNRPQSSECGTCSEPIGADAPAVLVDQPTVGQLVFLDGQKVEVDGALVLGRKPSVEPGEAGSIAIDQAEVSRSHASIAVEGWSAFVTDLGSRNGTFVCPPDNPAPVRLEAGVQHLLEVGTTVHLGGSEASFTFVAS